LGKDRKRNERATLFAIFLLINAVFLLFLAISVWPEDFRAPQRESFHSRGFVFKTTEMIDLNQSELKIAFSEINCENGTAKCEIIINPLLNKSSEYSSALFFLQIPYIATNTEIIFLTKNPEYFGGTTSIKVIQNLTYIKFDIPKEENYVVYNKKGTPTIIINFTIESAFRQLDWYTYEIPITFEGSLNRASNELQYLKDYNFYYPLFLFKTQRSFMYFEMTQKYKYSNFQPTYDDIKPWRNFDAYYWDLKKTSAKGSEHSIIVELTDPTSKDRIESRKMTFNVLLGIFVAPSVLYSVGTIIRFKDLFKEQQFQLNMGFVVIGSIIIASVLFVVLANYLL
jgi:hypothetical protein